jgi:hypothetical protein
MRSYIKNLLNIFRNRREIHPVGRQPIVEEFLNINLGDKRLSRRLEHLVDLLGNEFGAGIPEACRDGSEIKAAYRFFSNAHIDEENLLDTHLFNTALRVKKSEQNVFILAQDSTAIFYGSHVATTHLGSLAKSKGTHIKGIFCHAGLIYTSHGTPLGLLLNKLWFRKARSGRAKIRHKKKRDTIPIEKKESFRWIQGIHSARLIQEQSQKKVIVVNDREGDINEFYKTALDLEVGFVVRVDKSRVCNESGSQTIKKYLKNRPFYFEFEAIISQRGKITSHREDYRRYPVKTRKVLLQVWWEEVTIRLKSNSRSKKSEQKITVVLVDEKPLPAQKRSTILSWLLFTDQKIKSKEDALRVIFYYRQRWQVEEYFRILKSGCKVEDCRLGDGHKLIRYLKVMGIIAWRQHYLTEIGREYSKAPASTCLTPSEIKTLKIESKIDLADDLTLDQAWHLIAKLGGFMNRPSDGDPGPTTFWRGFQKLYYITHGAEQSSGISDQLSQEQLKAA